MGRFSVLALFAMILASCSYLVTEPEGTAAPLAISDGAHGGNPHFFFLPPLVAAPTYSGVFDGSLSPMVEILEDGALLTSYSMSGGFNSETISMSTEDEHYLVNWHTDQFSLDESLNYRIRVLVDQVELGFADVDVVDSGKQLKHVDTEQYIALKDGRTLPIKFRIEQEALPPKVEGILVTDWNDRIVRIDDMTGAGWTTYGSNGSGIGQFDTPYTLAVDDQGRIYVGDSFTNNRIVRIDDMTGAGWTAYGSSGSGVHQFNTIEQLAFDQQGRLLIVDHQNHRIVRVDDMTGAGWTSYGTLGSGIHQFNGVYGIALDSAGRYYITDRGNKRLVRVDDLSGTNWTELALPEQPAMVTVGHDGRVYIAINYINYASIVRVDNINGDNWVAFGTYGSGVGELLVPQVARLGVDNKIYIADAHNGRIVRIDDMTGAGWTTYGSVGPGQDQFGKVIDIWLLD